MNRSFHFPRSVGLQGTLLVCLVVLLGGCGPSDRRPGLWLSGEVQAYPTDWTFADAHQEIAGCLFAWGFTTFGHPSLIHFATCIIDHLVPCDRALPLYHTYWHPQLTPAV